MSEHATPGRRFRCPECHESDHLWQNVSFSGWEEIDAHLQPTGTREANDWDIVEREQDGGCTCGWEGSFSSLEAVGIDGEPLPLIHPHQTAIEVAA